MSHSLKTLLISTVYLTTFFVTCNFNPLSARVCDTRNIQKHYSPQSNCPCECQPRCRPGCQPQFQNYDAGQEMQNWPQYEEGDQGQRGCSGGGCGIQNPNRGYSSPEAPQARPYNAGYDSRDPKEQFGQWRGNK